MEKTSQPDFQRYVAIGRLTRDPEVKTLQSGKRVCSFSLASTLFGGGTLFLDCEAWLGNAWSCDADQRRKGDQVLLEGTLRLDSWEDKTTNEKRSKMRVVVSKCELLSEPKNRLPREEFNQPPKAFGANPPPKPGPPPIPPPGYGDHGFNNLDEDVPF